MVRLVPGPGPQRVIALSNLVNTVGSGIYLTAGVLYFTQAAGLPAGDVGWGLGLAGIVALGAGILVGHIADRRSARGVYAATLVVRGVGTAGFLLVDTFWPFVVAVCLATGAHTAGQAARAPIIRSHGGDRPQEFRAYLRALTNIGISFGALLAGWAVQVGTHEAYDLLVVGNAVSCAASAIFLVWLPSVAPVPAAAGPRWVALRDLPYLLVTALDGIMSIQFKVLTVALPLWLIEVTTAPRWLISVTMLVNTAIVVAFQVRASRGVDTPAAGGRAYRRSGVAFLASCGLLSFTAGVPTWVAVTVILTAVVIHAIGELWQSAAGFEVSFGLAPVHATGQYLGVFGLGLGLAETLGPGLLIALCIAWGQPGWYVVGAMFTVTGAAARFAVRWAERRRTTLV